MASPPFNIFFSPAEDAFANKKSPLISQQKIKGLHPVSLTLFLLKAHHPVIPRGDVCFVQAGLLTFPPF